LAFDASRRSGNLKRRPDSGPAGRDPKHRPETPLI
jgi:hypothetical protein